MNRKINGDFKSKTYKYHPIIIIKPIFKYLVFIFFVFIRELEDSFENGFSITSLVNGEIFRSLVGGGAIFLIIIAFSMINGAITYFKSHIELSREVIIYKKNTIFSKKHKETPLSQISNINFNRGILDRIFSTVEMQLDINSSETASESDYSILLKKSDAENFKQLFELYSHEIFDHEDRSILSKDSEQYQFDQVYEYKGHEFWRHIFLSTSITAILMGCGLFILTLSDIFESFSIISILLLLITFGYNAIKNIAKYYGYTVKSNEKYIYWNYGLFANKEFTIAKKDIRSIEMNQSLLARLFKCYSIDVKVVGVGNNNDELMTIVLYNPKHKAIKILNELIPNNDLNLNFESEISKVRLYKSLVAIVLLSPLLLIEIVRRYIFIYFIVLFLVIASIIIISRGKGFMYDGEKIKIISAFFGINMTSIYLKNVDHICVKKQPIYSKMGLCKIELFYKNNNGPACITTGYFPKEKIELLISDLIDKL